MVPSFDATVSSTGTMVSSFDTTVSSTGTMVSSCRHEVHIQKTHPVQTGCHCLLFSTQKLFPFPLFPFSPFPRFLSFPSPPSSTSPDVDPSQWVKRVMQSSQIMCRLGKAFPSLLSDSIDDSDSLVGCIRLLSGAGDVSAFSSLPPPLMTDSETISDQRLRPLPPSSSSAYAPGPPPLPPLGHLVGAAVFPFCGISHPALLFANHKTKTVTTHVYSVSLTSLESDLHRARTRASPIERTWKGDLICTSHLSLLEMMETQCRTHGPSSVPSLLLSDDDASVHLRRPGPIPLLHMRLPRNAREREMLAKTMKRYVALRCTAGTVPSPRSSSDLLSSFDASSEYQFQTFFSPLSMEDEEDEEEEKEEKEEKKKKKKDVEKAIREMASVPALAIVLACLLRCSPSAATLSDATTEDDDESSATSPSTFSSSSSLLPLDVLPESLSRLVAACPCSLHDVCILGKIGAASQAHCIASSLFSPSDVGACIRDVATQSSSAPQGRPFLAARTLLLSIANRVSDDACMMVIELGPSRDVKSIRLVNSSIDHQLGIDCAARLLGCDWVVPVGMLQHSKQDGSFFTLTSTSVRRRKLRVCDSVLASYPSPAEHKVRSPQFDFSKFDQRLSALEKLSESISERVAAPAPAPAPSPASSPAPPDEVAKLKQAQKTWKANRQENLSKRKRDSNND